MIRPAAQALPLSGGSIAHRDQAHALQPVQPESQCEALLMTLNNWCASGSVLHPQYAALFTPETDTMRSFFGQKDHVQVFCFILDCLDTLNI